MSSSFCLITEQVVLSLVFYSKSLLVTLEWEIIEYLTVGKIAGLSGTHSLVPLQAYLAQNSCHPD